MDYLNQTREQYADNGREIEQLEIYKKNIIKYNLFDDIFFIYTI